MAQGKKTSHLAFAALLACSGLATVMLMSSPQRVMAQVAQTAPAPGVQQAAVPAGEAVTKDPTQDQQLRVGIQQSLSLKTRLRQPDVNPQELGSLFFTVWQHALLQEAKRGFLARPPSQSDLQGEDADRPRPRGIRELSVGGIVYAAPKDWTVWLNGQRIKPDALPDQVLDIKVNETYVELKWFDAYSNLIYPVRLRAHERFNLDTRIFLPGVGTL